MRISFSFIKPVLNLHLSYSEKGSSLFFAEKGNSLVRKLGMTGGDIEGAAGEFPHHFVC